MKIGNELKIGMTIVIAVLIGFIGFRVMKDQPIFRQGTLIYATYDRVDGLSVGTPVIIRGIKIGSVQRLELLSNDSVRVSLSVTIPSGIPEGSVAYIRAVDILGSKGIDVERGPGPGTIPYGGVIKGVFDDGFFGEITERGGEIASNVSETTGRLSSLIQEFERIMHDGGRDNISSTLSNLEETSRQVEDLISGTNQDIKESVSSLRALMENLEELTSEERGELQRLIGNLESTSVELEEMSKNFNTLSSDLADIVRKVNDGEGTLGKLVNDPSLYNNLDSMSVSLNKLISDLNENPRHFLRHLRLIDVF